MVLDPDETPDEVAQRDSAERELAAAASPDTLDRMCELADMMTIVAAQRLRCVEALRREFTAASEHGSFASAEILDRSLRLEIAAALRITEYAAGELIALSDAVVHRYPAVLESLSAARMTERHASILVGALDGVEPEFRAEVLTRGVELAEAQPVGVFRRALRALVDALRVVSLAERHERALEARRVIVEQVDDGMGWLHLYGPMVELHAIHDRATRMGKVIAAGEDEERTLDQLRADIVCDLLIDGTVAGHPDTARGIRATVAVTVPALSLLAETDVDVPAGAHAVVEGVGPVPIALARELSGGADGWMRVLTHPETGMVLSVGRDQYRVPAGLRRLVRWRAERCMAPGCGMPASRCEIDHSIAWEHHGHTSLTNLAPLCTGHHIVKHHGRWIIRQIDGSGGALEWISPLGRRYVVEPERRVPVFRAALDESPAPF